MAVTRVSTDGLADSAVNSAKIGVDVITDTDLANNSVTANEITNNAVTTDKIAADAVTNVKVANSTLDLTTKVTGALPVANGGTGITSGFINGGATYTNSGSNLTGAATKTFDNIPSHAHRIRFIFYGVTPGNTELEIRVGIASGFINSGVYFNHISYHDNNSAQSVSYDNAATKWRTSGWSNTNNSFYGYYDLFKSNTDTNNHVHQDSALWNSGFTQYSPLKMAGFCNLGATSNVLTKVIFMTANGSNFSGGWISMTYM